MGLQSRIAVGALAAGLVAGTSAWGHHSVSGVFDAERPFEITGVVTDVEWINPHVYLHLEVTDAEGSVTGWRLETLPTAFLRKARISQAMLRGDGQPVTVTGITSHRDAHLGWVHRITYADGHYYQLSGG